MKKVMIPLTLLASMTTLTATRAAVINIPDDYPTIQAGIDAAADGDTILIADGVYTGNGNFNIDFKGKAIEVRSANGPETCVMDCQHMGRGFIFHSGETNSSILRGLTVTGGSADNAGGGAVYCDSASPWIENCRFIDNQSEGPGGALRYLHLAGGNRVTLFIAECLFENNRTEDHGGAIAIDDSLSSNILSCRIIDNLSADSGGGISCHASTTYISDTILSGNGTDAEGGGFHYFHGCYVMSNCLLVDNQAVRGGAISGDNDLEIMNCTLYGNSATESGGAIVIVEMEPQITNCIIRNNGPGAMPGFDFGMTSYSNIEGVPPSAQGCIDRDPLFVNGSSGNFYLSQTASGQTENSPCWNTGSAAAGSIGFPDRDGYTFLNTLTTRTDHMPDQALVDMGYHYSSEPPVPTPTPDPECDTLGCELEIPAGNFSPGDEFYCDALICNPTVNTFLDAPLYTVIDVYGEFYVLPFLLIDVPPGLSTHTVIPSFTWPENSGEGQAAIYCAMTNEAVSELFGAFGWVEFTWTSEPGALQPHQQ